MSVPTVISSYVFKVSVEAVVTPVTYLIAGFLKRVKREGYYDIGADFNPFLLVGGEVAETAKAGI